MEKNTVTKKVYTDWGHGWAAVKRKELYDLEIENKITQYSYQKGATVYLEEDCDMTTYLKAMEDRGTTVNLEYKDVGKYSPIRSYARYNKYG